MSNSEEERMVSNMLIRKQRIPKHLMNKYGLDVWEPRVAKMSANEKLARRIKYSTGIIFSNAQYRGPNFLNLPEIEKYGNFSPNDSINTIIRKIKLVKKLLPKEKALLTRLYEPYYAGIGQNVRNNAIIKPVRNWYLGVLAKKYGVPKNWLNENPAIYRSKAGRYIDYALTKKYEPQHANKNIAGKQLARKVSRVYSAALNRRIATAKKAVKKLPSPVRERVMNTAFPGTRRHRSPSVGRAFN